MSGTHCFRDQSPAESEPLTHYRRSARFPDDLYAGGPQISQLPPSLEYPRKQLPADFHFVGPLHDHKTRSHTDFPWEKLDGRPILYASMGTLMNQMEGIFRIILKASETLDVQLVLTLGGKLDPASFAGALGNPVIVHYAPQLEVLKRASICITAGGLNTINESLANGVPLVAIPITNDQPAAAAERSGQVHTHQAGDGAPASCGA